MLEHLSNNEHEIRLFFSLNQDIVGIIEIYDLCSAVIVTLKLFILTINVTMNYEKSLWLFLLCQSGVTL